VLGWFIGQSARAAVVSTAFSERIDGITVADIMDAQPVAMPATTPLTQAQDEYFLRYRWDWFPVVDERGRFVGVVQTGPRNDLTLGADDHDESIVVVDLGQRPHLGRVGDSIRFDEQALVELIDEISALPLNQQHAGHAEHERYGDRGDRGDTHPDGTEAPPLSHRDPGGSRRAGPS
jgi:hypothetical protein